MYVIFLACDSLVLYSRPLKQTTTTSPSHQLIRSTRHRYWHYSPNSNPLWFAKPFLSKQSSVLVLLLTVANLLLLYGTVNLTRVSRSYRSSNETHAYHSPFLALSGIYLHLIWAVSKYHPLYHISAHHRNLESMRQTCIRVYTGQAEWLSVCRLVGRGLLMKGLYRATSRADRFLITPYQRDLLYTNTPVTLRLFGWRYLDTTTDFVWQSNKRLLRYWRWKQLCYRDNIWGRFGVETMEPHMGEH